MTEDPSALALEVAAVTDRGLSEKRPENEDSLLSDPERHVFAVADGVGGAQAGEVASQTAIEVLQGAFANQHDDEDVEDLMEIAIQRANDSIYRMSREQPRFAMMATTIVALHLDGLRATVGHVGDSRLYRLTPDGQLRRETQDHSLVEEEMRAGRLTPEQAANHPGRNVISRALGAEASVEVDMRTFEFEDGSTFLLCSDGITRHIPDAELSALLREARTPDAACEEMKRRCYERGAEDNLTAVVVRVGTGGGRARHHAAEDEDDEQTLVRERPAGLHNAHTLPDTPSPMLRRPFDTAGVGLATAAPAAAKTETNSGEAADVSSAAPGETRRESGARAAEAPRKSGRGLLTAGVFLLVLCAVGLAFYVGVMFERKGVSKQIGSAREDSAQAPAPTTAAAPTPAATAAPESAADRFERLRRAVDLAPAPEAARMAAEAGGHPLDSRDPEFLYLYGRALLLSDRQVEAADAFDRAILRINENMTPANGELKIDARIAKVAAHLRARDEAAAVSAADALSEVVRPAQQTGPEAGAVPTP